MRRKAFVIVTLLLLVTVVLAGCSGATSKSKKSIKVGQVTDTGGIDDQSFNQTAWKGVEDAIDKLKVEGRYLESQQPTDYAKNITEFVQQDYELIVTVGYLLGEDTAKFAQENPDVKFAIVDYAYDPVIDNVLGMVYATDQASFLAGYLAAGMSKTGKVATFGGMEIPPVTIFMVGYTNGVKYYNEQNGTSVEVLGADYYVGNFESTDDGRRAAESLMDEGADIVFPVAGPVGVGAAEVVQERGGMFIGVDADMYVTAPKYQDIMLTSVMKNIDVSVYEAIEAVQDGTFKGGVMLSTLANGGVGLAPYHDFESKVPKDLQKEIEQLTKDLADGKVATGWQ
jgi:basic membrane protein A